MLFSSLVFLFWFFPIFIIIYFSVRDRTARNIILLCASLVFYAWGEPLYVFLMIFSIVFNHFLALIIQQKMEHGSAKSAKSLMIGTVALNLLFLTIFKYSGFIASTINSIAGNSIVPVPEIALPIGISFYTFQMISYVIDVYRRQISAQRNILFLGAYFAAFPQLVAGPVVRYDTIAEQLVNRRETIEDFAAGMKRFAAGLAKKVLIANTMAFSVDNILGFSGSDYGIIGAWIAMIAYTLQIYFDFSGYSDMAIGMGRMMGFKYLENFNYPYISTSITDFWRRWHISMSSFFRDYVYIPLGGNRVSTGRWIFNMAVVWACTGLWHGADWTFILWGIYFGTLLVIEKLFIGRRIEKLPVIKNIYALLFIVIGWAVFRAESVSQMLEIFKAMFGGYGLGGESISAAAVLQQSECGLIFYAALAAGIVASMPVSRLLKEKFSRFKYGAIAMDIFVFIAIIACAAELALGSYNPFIYFDF